MAKKDVVYVVTMYRWGERASHSYVLGVFSKKAKAIDQADREGAARGGKYQPEVVEVVLDKEMAFPCRYEHKAIVDLTGEMWG